ncbi:unnamed protein product [Spirodela intermedia]|uniref:Uncharacterized protein n=1 Tax=Spirodela intermedia TaxID=51605 RepID=A0A7I8K786_SPIIN|nr:unnamed protein product [Spirodela intermedia]
MKGVWSWITDLPDPEEWPETADSRFILEVAGSPAKSVALKAERTAGSNSEALATFSVCLQGFHPSIPSKTLWVSNPCPISSDGRYGLYPLLLQLVQEVISRAPSSGAAAGVPPKLDLRRFFTSWSPRSEFAHFFDLVFLSRLFWLCACDSPAEVGYLFFQAMNARLESSLDCREVMREFLLSGGVDWEMLFMRSLGYLLAKRSILRELSPPSESGDSRPSLGSFSYAAESHGLWVLRGYAPILSMARTNHAPAGDHLEAKEALLRYALAHQQLESVLQLEYSVAASRPGDRFLRVAVRVDNLRLLVARLGFGKGETEEDDPAGGAAVAPPPDERHFPSRVRVWVGPELGSAGVSCLSLGRSTENPEREMEREQTVKAGLGDSKFPRVKAVARTTARSRTRAWRWEQAAEGNLAVFEGVLCDPATGAEAAAWRPGAAAGGPDPRGAMRRRYTGPGRVFNKGGGLVVAGEEHGQWASWRVGREMEGKVMRWRVGAKIWVTYWPNELKSSYVETRCVEWRDDVELPLVGVDS